MQPTYFASFLLSETPSAPDPGVADALAVIYDCIFGDPRHGIAKPNGWSLEAMEPLSFPEGQQLTSILVKDGNTGAEAAGVRFEHPDPGGRTWRSDCVLSRLPSGGLRFSVTIMMGNASGNSTPMASPHETPRIVHQIIDFFGARESGFPLKNTFFHLGPHDIERFIDFLPDPDRVLPVVLVTQRSRDNAILVDPVPLAQKLAGLAQVWVTDTPAVGRTMSKLMDSRLTQLKTYEGAIRIYWPGLRHDDSPFHHRLWMPAYILSLQQQGCRLDDVIRDVVAQLSVTRYLDEITRWEDVEHLGTKLALRERHAGERTKEEMDQLLAIADQDIERLTSELTAAQKGLQDKAVELAKKEEEVQEWRELYANLQAQLPEARNRPAKQIDDARAAIEAAKQDFAGRLVFLENRIHKEAYAFEQPELLYAALRWLATQYLAARRGEQRCDRMDEACRAASRFFYAKRQSPATMGQYYDDYHANYRGKDVVLEEHIGYGKSTEPRRSIRIAFFYDLAGREVVVGFLGQHQQNAKSN